MKIYRSLLAVLLVGVLAALFVGCSSKNDNQESLPQNQSSSQASMPSREAKALVRIGALQGPTGLGLVRLMEENDNKESNNIYEFTMAGAPDELTGKIISGELDIVAVPTNLASVLYNRTEGKVKIIAVNTLGVLYLLQSGGDPVESVKDLEDRTVYSTGQGATQEYVLNYLLEQNGLVPGEDVEVEYRSEHAELASLMIEGSAELALLPQPFVTTVTNREESIETVLDITEEWEKVTGGAELTMGCLIVREEFLERSGPAVEKFLEEYKASTQYVNAHVDEAAALSGKYDVVAEEVAKQAIPHCNIVYLAGEDMKQSVSAYLEILYKADETSVGGELPDDAFYYLP